MNETKIEWFSLAKELVTVILMVLVLIGLLVVCGMGVASIKSKQAIAPDSDGVISLVPFRAVVTGDLELFPVVRELQTDDYAYTHGRAVLKERLTRKATNWHGAGDQLNWQFRVKETGKYQVRLRYSCEADSEGSQLGYQIDDAEQVALTLRNTGGLDKWKSLKLGEVILEKGRHQLLILGSDANKATNFAIERVVLSR